MIELMKLKLSFAQSEIQDGDVICFQVDLPDKEYAVFFSRVALLILQQDS
jgi:ubiquitin carboxyl-terminal hydrolase 7